MRSVAEAREHILEHIRSTAAERRMLAQALGQVLAEEVLAPVDSPRFHNSAMDGYAVRWSDVSGLASGGDPVRLTVAVEVAAGSTAEKELSAGYAARIMTGAPLPSGTDTVVMQEDTKRDGDTVIITRLSRARRGAHVRRRGSYFEAGGVLLPAGCPLEPGAIGLLASIGRTVVSVHRRPRVAVVATGDELIQLDQRPGPGQIYNSSPYMVAGLVERSGGIPILTEIGRDTVEDCRRRFEDALTSADLVVSLGGVSVGKYDVVREVLASLDASMGFWKVKMKPGKPLAFGVVDGRPVLGLPGNPVSTFVAFYQFVYPAIRRAQGLAGSGRLPVVRARLGAAVRSPAQRLDFQRGSLHNEPDGLTFQPVSDQTSGNLTSVVGPDGLALIPEGVAGLEAGEMVNVEVLPNGSVRS
jgi:molybdopterin molybdotransferase